MGINWVTTWDTIRWVVEIIEEDRPTDVGWTDWEYEMQQ